MLLLAKGDEEVFTESPVGKRAQMIHLADFQPSDFSDGDFRSRILRVIVVNSVLFNSVVFNSKYLRKRQCTLLLYATRAINQCLQEVRWVYRVRPLYEFPIRHRLRALCG